MPQSGTTPKNLTAGLERETGIEPASLAWKAKVLPLNYSRLPLLPCHPPKAGAAADHSDPCRLDHEPRLAYSDAWVGGGGWIRTSVGVSQQIYSLPPLATRAPLRNSRLATLHGFTNPPGAPRRKNPRLWALVRSLSILPTSGQPEALFSRPTRRRSPTRKCSDPADPTCPPNSRDHPSGPIFLRIRLLVNRSVDQFIIGASLSNLR
jgi:hypothetical protein